MPNLNLVRKFAGKFKETFAPSAEEGAARRMRAFGTTSKAPAIGLAAGIAAGGLVGGVAGAASRGVPMAARAVGSVAQAARAMAGGATLRSLANPFAGGIKGFFTGLPARTLGYGAIQEAVALGKAGISGTSYSPFITSSPRTALLHALAGGIGGFPGYAISSAVGYGGKAAADVINLVKGIDVPNVPNPVPWISQEAGDLWEGAQNLAGDVWSSVGGVMSGFSLPNIEATIKSSGIGFDIFAALVATLGLAGAIAYIQKRKRKKYKRSKRKKRDGRRKSNMGRRR